MEKSLVVEYLLQPGSSSGRDPLSWPLRDDTASKWFSGTLFSQSVWNWQHRACHGGLIQFIIFSMQLLSKAGSIILATLAAAQFVLEN